MFRLPNFPRRVDRRRVLRRLVLRRAGRRLVLRLVERRRLVAPRFAEVERLPAFRRRVRHAFFADALRFALVERPGLFRRLVLERRLDAPRFADELRLVALRLRVRAAFFADALRLAALRRRVAAAFFAAALRFALDPPRFVVFLLAVLRRVVVFLAFLVLTIFDFLPIVDLTLVRLRDFTFFGGFTKTKVPRAILRPMGMFDIKGAGGGCHQVGAG